MNGSAEGALRHPLEPDGETLVTVQGLKKYFPIYEGVLRRRAGEVRAVDDVDFTISEGDTFGLVGESGSGKTTLGKAMLRIIEPTGGRVTIDGHDVTAMGREELRGFRRNMQIVFQDPTSSLNPRKRVGAIIKEPMRVHAVGSAGDRTERAKELLSTVGLPEEYFYRYPNALSGGQKQRVGIARAVALNPKFVVLDEPTSALDVSVQARIVDLLDDLQDRLDLTYLFISHDLSLIKNVADWIGVMYLGQLVEVGPAAAVFRHPQHPYTRALLSSIPTITEADAALKPPEIMLEGEIPDPQNRPQGCSFRSRCPEAFGACADREPPLYPVPGTEAHFARCLYHDDAHAEDAPEWMARRESAR